jgi:hypothetical protein
LQQLSRNSIAIVEVAVLIKKYHDGAPFYDGAVEQKRRSRRPSLVLFDPKTGPMQTVREG